MARSRDAALNVKIGGSSKAFEAAMAKAERRLQSFGNQMKSIGSNMSTYITAPLLALAAGSLVGFGRLDALKRSLNTVTKSAEETEKEFKRLLVVAKLPGLGLEEAVRGSVNLQSAGFSADLARRSLLAFGNALATVGKGKNELNLVNLALTQLQNKTSGFAQDLRQLTEQLPQLRGILKEAFGTSDSLEIAKLGYTGEQVVKVLIREFEKLPKVTGGIQNAFENFSDATKISFARVGEAINKAFDIEGKITRVGEIIDNLSERFANLNPETQRTILVFTGLAAAIGPVALAIGTLSKAIPVFVAGLRSMAIVISPMALTIGGIIVGVAALALALKSAYDVFPTFKSALDSVGEAIKNFATNVTTGNFEDVKKVLWEVFSVEPILRWLTAIQRAGEYLNEKSGGVLGKVFSIDPLINFAKGAKEAITDIEAEVAKVGESLEEPADKFGDAFMNNVTAIKEYIASLFESITKGADSAGQNMYISLSEALSNFANDLSGMEDLLLKTAKRINLSISKIGLGKEIEDRDNFKPTYDPTTGTISRRPRPSIPPAIETAPVSGIPQRGAEDVQAAADKANELVSKFQYITDEAQAMQAAVNGAISDMAVGVADAFGDMFANLNSGGNALASFGKALFTTLSKVVQQLGQAAIKIGITQLAIFKALTALGPISAAGAIVAGVALVAFGKVMERGLSNMVPSLAIGTNMVRSDGLAQLHKGEAVVPASVVGGGFRGGSNDFKVHVANIGRELMMYIEQQSGYQNAKFGG